MATHSSILAWEVPWRKLVGLVCRVAKSWTRPKCLSTHMPPTGLEGAIGLCGVCPVHRLSVAITGPGTPPDARKLVEQMHEQVKAQSLYS